MNKAETDNIREMPYFEWKYHPTWLTERQHREKKLIPTGDPVAKVWYTNKYLQRSGEGGHWLLLWDSEKAEPKVVTEQKRAALARAKETAQRNRTCPLCKVERDRKVEVSNTYGVRMCRVCFAHQTEIQEARAWLRPGVFILDTETSGLSPSADNILSITVRDAFDNIWADWLIKPDKPINELGRAFEINGISNEMVKDAPTWADVWPEMHSWLRGNLVLCYNVAFDRSFIQGMAQRAKLPYHGIQWACVMEWYAEWHGEWDYRRRAHRWCKRTTACWEQDVKIEDAHTAGGDTKMTLDLIRTIAGKLAPLDDPEAYYDNLLKRRESL